MHPWQACPHGVRAEVPTAPGWGSCQIRVRNSRHLCLLGMGSHPSILQQDPCAVMIPYLVQGTFCIMKSRCWSARHAHAHTVLLAVGRKMAACPRKCKTWNLKHMRGSFSSTLSNPQMSGLCFLAVHSQRDASHPAFNSFWPLGSPWDHRKILSFLDPAAPAGLA